MTYLHAAGQAAGALRDVLVLSRILRLGRLDCLSVRVRTVRGGEIRGGGVGGGCCLVSRIGVTRNGPRSCTTIAELATLTRPRQHVGFVVGVVPRHGRIRQRRTEQPRR